MVLPYEVIGYFVEYLTTGICFGLCLVHIIKLCQYKGAINFSVSTDKILLTIFSVTNMQIDGYISSVIIIMFRNDLNVQQVI